MARKTLLQKVKAELKETKEELRKQELYTHEVYGRVRNYEKKEQEEKDQAWMNRQRLEDQVMWMRQLVENMTLPAENIRALTEREVKLAEIRIQEEELRNQRYTNDNKASHDPHICTGGCHVSGR